MGGRPHKVSPDPKLTKHSSAVTHLLQEEEVVKALAPLNSTDHSLTVDDNPQLAAVDTLSRRLTNRIAHGPEQQVHCFELHAKW